MSLKEQKEKLIEEECSMCPYSNSRECAECPIDHLLDRLAASEEKVKQLTEALKAIDEAITDNCISDAQMMIKNIIKQISGEQEG